MAKDDVILSVRNLTTQLLLGGQAVNVVNDLSFDLKKGKTLALVGESGCGKSMTALSLMRILPEPTALPSTGKVLYRGQNLLTLSEAAMRQIRGSRIAMIFQDPSTALNPVYTIGDQLAEVASLHLDLYGDAAVERVILALEEVGIASPRDRLVDYPHQLSGGMKQRVMIAMALMCEPDVLVADEPTTALDVTIQAQVLDLIRVLQKERGMAVLLITHNMGVVAEMANEVMVMYATKAVECGEVMAIFDDMAHPYTQGLFLSRPHRNTPHGGLQAIKGTVPPITRLPEGCPFNTRCPHVMEKCKHGPVPNFPIKHKKHVAACWLHEPGFIKKASNVPATA